MSILTSHKITATAAEPEARYTSIAEESLRAVAVAGMMLVLFMASLKVSTLVMIGGIVILGVAVLFSVVETLDDTRPLVSKINVYTTNLFYGATAALALVPIAVLAQFLVQTSF